MGWLGGAGAQTQGTAGYFSNLRFRTKIMLGFLAVLGISAVSMATAYFGFERIAVGVSAYHDIVAETDRARDIDRDLTAYQLLARYYAVSGLDQDLAAARAAETDLGNAIDRARRLASDANRQDIARLSETFAEFSKLFGRVVAIKGENASVAANQLNRFGNTLRYKFDDLSDTAIMMGDSSLQSTLKELLPQAAAISANISNYVARPDKAVASGVNARMQMLKSSLSSLNSSDARIAPKITEIAEQLNVYRATFATFVDNTALIDQLNAKMGDAAKAITQDAKAIKEGLLARQEALAGESATAARTTGWFVTILGIGGLLLGASLAMMLGAGISRPMVAMCAAMRQLAGGDFAVVLPGLGRRDEVGEMAAAVEEFKQRAIARAEHDAAERENHTRVASNARSAELHRFADNFEAAVGVIVTSVSSSASQLESAAVTLTRTVEAAQDLSGRVASASEEASSNVQSVAAATEELSASVNEIGRQVQESSRIAAEAVQQAEATDARIVKLSRAAQQIGDVVKLITAIAEQTNLLALNAAIEAARAGEQGRGFAVVADEVQRLAERSAAATKQIEQLVKTIQTDTNEAVISMEQTTAEVVRGARLAQDAGVALGEIESVSRSLADLIQNISNAARQQAASAGHISNTMNVIQEITSQTTAGTIATARSIGNLAEMANELRQSVAGFKLPEHA